MKELIFTQFDAFLTWAGIMFLILGFLWCWRVARAFMDSRRWKPRPEVSVFGDFLERMEAWRSPLTLEGRCWAMIAAATVSLWISAAWAALAA